MPIAARLFSMKYAARRCRTFKPPNRVQFLFRRMQPRDSPGAFWNLRAVAAQMHRVAQAGLLQGLRDPIAISLLLLPGFRRRQHRICRARTAEGFGERCRVAHGGRERFRALAHKALQSPASRPTTRTFLPSDSRELAMIEPVFPLAPKIACMASVATAAVSLRLFILVPLFLSSPIRSVCNPGAFCTHLAPLVLVTP